MNTLPSPPPNPKTVARLPYAFARQHHLLCLDASTPQWQVACCAATPAHAIAEVQRMAPAPVQWHWVDNPADLQTWLGQAYANQDTNAASVADELASDMASDLDLQRLMQDIPAIEDLLDSEADAPIVRMINALLTQASREGASDLHLEAFESHSAVRFRVDGRLRDVLQPRRELHAALISRIKIMANLDIAEKRLPQDGRIALRIGGKAMDVRVSTLPTGHGERAVLRLLDKDKGRLQLSTLGMAAPTLATVDELCRAPHGIVLVTGPTGSGKTTTLYAALSRLDATTTNIMTVEDPVEYDLPGIAQTPVNSKIDMSFAKALRALLRQDPDVIMIGEIRDTETAQIAVQASLTGHLVLATLHTNDSVSAVTRLVDMGIEPFLLSSSLLGVLAQRLVRCLCPHCKVQTVDAQGQRHWQAQGCEHCAHTGYLGRTGVYELLQISPTLRDLIHQQAAESTLRQQAQAEGMQTMQDDGQRWLQAGITTPEELLRVTNNDKLDKPHAHL